MHQPDTPGAAERLARPGASLLADAQYKGLQALLAALDHLIDQHEWARSRLKLHAGRELELACEPPAPGVWVPQPLRLRVNDAGRLEPASRPADDTAAQNAAASAAMHDPSQAQAAVRMTLKPSVDAFFAVLNGGPTGLQRHLRIEGDVLFAAALGELAQGLSWDAEEDLSRWVGDVAAHRMVASGRLLADSLRQSLERAIRSAARFAATESQALVSRPELDLHRDELRALDHRIAALERQRRR